MKRLSLLERDSRITLRGHRFIVYFVVLCVCTAVSVGFLFFAEFLWGCRLPGQIVALLLGLFTVFVSALLSLAVGIIYMQYTIRPIAQVKYAARKVAAGDYSVRIPPRRKDGKKDEFQVLYDDFNAMVAELASTEILKSDFVADVSHELKTPLAAIQSLSTMLQTDALSEEERVDCAVRIAEASRRLSSLVTDILQLSRLENQEIAVQNKRYDLSEQLRRCVLGFEHVWEEKHIDVEADLDEVCTVAADERLMEIVWNNLLSNAFKFTPAGGSVEVLLKEEKGHAVITVKDSGCGMSEGEAKHAFDKFYQADPSHATQGNGLGLALVRRIAALHGASVSVVSRPGEGSIFTVTL